MEDKLSPEAQEIKRKQRAILRAEYWKQITNPHTYSTGEGGHLFDAGMQRFLSMKATQYDHFRPSPRSSAWGLVLLVIPLGLTAYILKTTRDKQEHLYRTGMVAYADRKFKFQ